MFNEDTGLHIGQKRKSLGFDFIGSFTKSINRHRGKNRPPRPKVNKGSRKPKWSNQFGWHI